MQPEGQEPPEQVTEQPSQFRGTCSGRQSCRIISPPGLLRAQERRLFGKEACYSLHGEVGCQGQSRAGKENWGGSWRERNFVLTQPTGQAASGDGDGENETDPFQGNGESG